MGDIGSKLRSRFRTWNRVLQREIKREQFQVPKNLGEAQASGVAQGLDPLHGIYGAVQNLVDLFSIAVSESLELEPYLQVLLEADERYTPEGPPKSPITLSCFTTWAFFDLRIGRTQETIGTLLLDVSDLLDLDSGIVEAIRQFSGSRMGIYEHVGNVDGRIHLRELITEKEHLCFCTAGYEGKAGELWYVRLCPPLGDRLDYHVTMTTPYILTKPGRNDWIAYLKRAMLSVKAPDESERLYELLKIGKHWHQFVVQAYHSHQAGAIFLEGLPDVKGSLPHGDKV